MKIKTVVINEDTAQTSIKEIDIKTNDIKMMAVSGLYYVLDMHDGTQHMVTTKEYFRILANW